MKTWPLLAAAISTFQAPVLCLDKKNKIKDKTSEEKKKPGLKQVKKKCKKLINQVMQETGAPGMVVAVSVNGRTVWSKGFGFSDVENKVPCQANTVMRVASISKAFTSVAMARLWEAGKLDLDKPIQEYLQDFPRKDFNGSEVAITLRQLLSHTSGIRHYSKNLEDDSDDEFSLKEYYITKPYKNVTESLNLFKDDPLLKRPGEEFLYTTHGWTLVSAIMEKASGQDFLMMMNDLFQRMGMQSTVPDFHDRLVYNRARCYDRNKNGKLINSPYVNLSYKWAGGGFLSTVGDLLKFGNIMIYSYQHDGDDERKPSPMLRSKTIKQMWSAVAKPERSRWFSVENQNYGLGWSVYPEMEVCGLCPESRLEVSHTGAAVGASSILFIVPGTKNDLSKISSNKDTEGGVHGIVVAVICNLQGVSLSALARSIAREFEKAA